MTMMHTEYSHLTAEQIDEALMGCLSGNAYVHLAVCGNCAERVAEARLPLASFKSVGTAWSERRSATLPQISIESARPQRFTWGAAAVTAMLGFVIAIPVTQHRQRVDEAARIATSEPQMAAVSTPVMAPVAAPEQGEVRVANPDDERITRDNQMLDVIDQELGATEGPAEVQPVRVRTNARSVTATEQD
jgi:hypothetical protein